MERRKRRSPVEEYIDSLMDSPEKLERCTQFYQNLRGFYRRKWNCPLKAPYIQGVEVNLFQLYEVVNSFGGWQKVSAGEKWAHVAQAVGIAEGVAVAEHAIKILYMRYLSKYEQNETVGDVDDTEAELIGSRSRGKGFSSLANADCPISAGGRYNLDLFRGRTEKRGEPEYSRLVKSLYCGLPNEVDFAINVCTLLSHPGPRFLRLASAPQILVLLVAHVAVFADDDDSMYELHKTWEQASGHNFIAFWEDAGIEDEEILALLPHVQPSKISNIDLDLFGGLVHEFRLKDVVSWRVHQILSIIRNLSFEVINKPVMASCWPLMKFLFVCCGCKWSSLRTAALDALSNIASEIDLLCEESSTTNHLLLKTISHCLHSGDKLQIIRALEILAGLCNNERNESLLCEFLDYRVLSKIFEVLIVKDMMMCVYTVEALYQVSELGAAACQQISSLPHAIEILVNLATVEAVSFGPSGLSGIKVVEFHGPPQLAPPPPQNPSAHARYVPRQANFATPAPPVTYSASARAAVAVHSPAVRGAAVAASPVPVSAGPVIGESKVEQLTAKWLRLNCLCAPGNVIPRGEIYAAYVEDLRHHYNALSGSVQMFTNIMKALFPTVVVHAGSNTTSIVIENLKYAKGQGVAAAENGNMPSTTVSAGSTPANTMAASHPVMQKILLASTVSPAQLPNGHLMGIPIDKGSAKADVSANVQQPPVFLPVSVQGSLPSVATTTIPDKVKLEVCREAVEAKDFIPDDGRHEARIVRVENTAHTTQSTPQAAFQPPAVNLVSGASKGASLVITNSNPPQIVAKASANASVVISNDTLVTVVKSSTSSNLINSKSCGNNSIPGAVTSAEENSILVASSVSKVPVPAISKDTVVPGVISGTLPGEAVTIVNVPDALSNTLAPGSSAVGTATVIGNAHESVVFTPSNGTVSTTESVSVVHYVASVVETGCPMPAVAAEVTTSSASNASMITVAANQVSSTIAAKAVAAMGSPKPKSSVAHRLNGLKEEKVEKLVNGHAHPGLISTHRDIVAQKTLTNGVASTMNTEIKAETSNMINQTPTVVLKDGFSGGSSATCGQGNACDGNITGANAVVPAKRRRTSRCNTPRVNEHSYSERIVPSTSSDCGGDFMCEWNGCGRFFPTASFVLYHCAKEHVGDQLTLQCHWPRCDSTVRTKLSMVTHLQDHHCSEALLMAAAKRRKEGYGTVLGPVNPERPRDMHQHPGYAKNAAIEAIRRHAFNYLPRDITDDSEGPVTKSIRLTSSLILRNLARYSTDGRRLIRRHETLLSWLASSRLESSSALSQLLAELYSNQPSSS